MSPDVDLPGIYAARMRYQTQRDSNIENVFYVYGPPGLSTDLLSTWLNTINVGLINELGGFAAALTGDWTFSLADVTELVGGAVPATYTGAQAVGLSASPTVSQTVATVIVVRPGGQLFLSVPSKSSRGPAVPYRRSLALRSGRYLVPGCALGFTDDGYSMTLDLAYQESLTQNVLGLQGLLLTTPVQGVDVLAPTTLHRRLTDAGQVLWQAWSQRDWYVRNVLATCRSRREHAVPQQLVP